MDLDLERLGLPVIKFLEGKYAIYRLDENNLLLQKKVMKKTRTVKVKNAKGKVVGEKEIGGYEGYVRMGYHGDLESAITSILADAEMDVIGDEKTITPIKAFRKNIIRIKKTLVEEIREAAICKCKLTREDEDDD
jgi:hypothetical protein